MPVAEIAGVPEAEMKPHLSRQITQACQAVLSAFDENYSGPVKVTLSGESSSRATETVGTGKVTVTLEYAGEAS